MADQLKNLVIGIFVLAALAIVVFIILFLHPTVGDEGQTIYVRFADIDKVNIGTKVTFAGKQVGEVAGIKEVVDTRTGPQDQFGRLYVYQLKLLIDSGVEVYETDQISLRTSGLLGERSVSIIPKALKSGQEPRRMGRNDVLYASETGSLEDALIDVKKVADKMSVALDEITQNLKEFREEQFAENFGLVAKNLADITTSLNEPVLWSELLHSVHTLAHQAVGRFPNTWDRLDDVLIRLNSAVKSSDDIFGRINRGEGSLGKILAQEDLYLNTKALLNKVETIADDINHYGLMFHQDKSWQRLRARRLNLLQKLCTPQEFRNYFNDEINQITTSLSRVSMVLDEMELCWTCCDYAPCLLEDPEFAKVFAELMRRVDTMQEALQMYNIQAVECEAGKTELRN